MENKLQVFKNEEFGEIRTFEIDGEPYFVGKDVASVLGYKEPRSAVSKKVDEEDRGVSKIATPSGTQEMTVINESGLYSLILSSKLPTAKKFKRWVTSDVLPSIRKHGTYMTDDTLEKALTSPDFLIKLATELKEEKEQRQALEEEKKLNAPKVVFADAVSTSKTSILVGELSKILKQNGINIGQNRLFSWLRENDYLIKRKGTDWNMPTQKSMDMKLFEIKESTHLNGNGVNVTTKTPKVTGKGQQYFINKFLNEGNNGQAINS